MARKARPVAVAKAPKARAADESSSPVLGRAWLPCLCLGSLTSEDDAEVVIEADNEVLNDSLIEVETLTEAEMLVEALADSEKLIESETDWLVETEALVLDDSLSETEALVLDDSLSDVDLLIETEAKMLVEALADSEALSESEIEALALCDSETD